MKQKIAIYLITIMLLGVMLMEPAIIAQSSGTPIYQSKNDKKTFNPTVVGKNSYYIIPASENYISGVTYSSNVGGTLTSTHQNSNSYSFTSNSYNSYTDGQGLFSTDYYNSPMTSTNIFMNNTYNVPTAVQIDNNQSSLTVTQTTPFSLHQNETLTMFGAKDTTYYAAYQHTGNFILDFSVLNTGSSVYLSVYSGTAFIYSQTISSKASIPIFSQATNFYLVLSVQSSNTLIKITPHEMKTEYYKTTNLGVNTTAQFTVNQGQCYDQSSSGNITGSSNLLSTMNVFDLPIQSNNYYEIYINQMNNDQASCSSTGSIQSNLLNQTSYSTSPGPSAVVQYISGSLNQNGFQFQALQSGNISLLINALYYMNKNVTVFFRQISKPKPTMGQVPVELNKPVTLYPSTYNTFTITKPSMVAFNTSGSNIADLYKYNSSSTNWNLLYSDFSNFYYQSSNFLNDYYYWTQYYSYNFWYYVPVGTYAITPLNGQMPVMINAVPVTTLSGTTSQTVPITNTSLYAFALSASNYQYQTFNLSTTQLDNVSVQYEYITESMYNELVPLSYHTQYLGNLYTGFADGTNDTTSLVNLRFTNNRVPIVLIHPQYAENSSNGWSALSSFSTKLTVKTKVYTSGLMPNGIEYMNPTAVDSTTPTSINLASANYQSNTAVYYYIPLTTDSNSLYNLTVSGLGNTTTSQNLTINSITTFGGKFANLDTGFQNINVNTYNKSLMSQIILTQSNPSYLQINIYRNTGNTNGTIVISLTKVSSATLSFGDLVQNNFLSLTWSPTVTNYENFDANPIFTFLPLPVKTHHSTPGFEVVMAVAAIITLPVIKKLKKKNKLE